MVWEFTVHPGRIRRSGPRGSRWLRFDRASSEIANRTVQAHRYFTAENDGLAQEWPLGRIWMNPPYAQPIIGQFAEKMAQEVQRGFSAIVLVNNATETAWFQTMATEASAICFPKGRIRFVDPKASPPAPLSKVRPSSTAARSPMISRMSSAGSGLWFAMASRHADQQTGPLHANRLPPAGAAREPLGGALRTRSLRIGDRRVAHLLHARNWQGGVLGSRCFLRQEILKKTESSSACGAAEAAKPVDQVRNRNAGSTPTGR